VVRRPFRDYKRVGASARGLLKCSDRIAQMNQNLSDYNDVELAQCLRKIVHIAAIEARRGIVEPVSQPVSILDGPQFNCCYRFRRSTAKLLKISRSVASTMSIVEYL